MFSKILEEIYSMKKNKRRKNERDPTKERKKLTRKIKK